MILADSRRYEYRVDNLDEITSVSSQWSAFARENGADGLTPESIVGRSLWDFVDGQATIEIYRSLMQRIRENQKRVVVPFRCDSPSLKRYMLLDLEPEEAGGIKLTGILTHVLPRHRIDLLNTNGVRSEDRLTMCSFCKRVLIEPTGWAEIEDAVVQLRLLEKPRVPRIQYSVCSNCSGAVSKLATKSI